MTEEKTCVNCGNFGDPDAEYICEDCMGHLHYPVVKTGWIPKNKK